MEIIIKAHNKYQLYYMDDPYSKTLISYKGINIKTRLGN